MIYSFTGINGDGEFPAASVVIGKNGALYGTTEFGGSATSPCPAPSFYVPGGCGTVFKLTPPSAPGGAWTETVLHDFTDANGDGANPVAPLVLSSNGVFYGTTSAGGTAGKGTIFARRAVTVEEPIHILLLFATRLRSLNRLVPCEALKA